MMSLSFLRNLQIEPCEEPLWARGGHQQTILGHLLPSQKLRLRGEEKIIDLQDGDKLQATYYKGTKNFLVYLFHGLGGSAESDYMERTVQVAHDLDLSVLSVNHRGCGKGRRLAKQAFHSGRHEDLAKVIAYGRALHPDFLHIAIGFSLSGNALLLRMAETQNLALPDVAIAVNSPLHLQRAVKKMQRGFNKIYDWRFYRRCKIEVYERYLDGLIQDAYQFKSLGSLYDFDQIYTAPVNGFKSREEYYEQCSSSYILSDIQKPTILLTSADDPFVDCEEYLKAKLAKNTILHVEKHGGHMGYLNRYKTPLGNLRWLDYALKKYLQALTQGHTGIKVS